jgi:hypothetical protein
VGEGGRSTKGNGRDVKRETGRKTPIVEGGVKGGGAGMGRVIVKDNGKKEGDVTG